MPDLKNVAAATYMDTGANDHITGDLEKLAMREKYSGNDQIHTTSGTSNNSTLLGSGAGGDSLRAM